MNPLLIVTFLRTLASAAALVSTALLVLADGVEAQPAQTPTNQPPSQPPVVVPPVQVNAILNETYAAYRARGGAVTFGPEGEVAPTSVFNGTNWAPVS